jgi:hypothetical protein
MLPSAINLGIAKVVAELLNIKGSRRALAVTQKARCFQHWPHFGFEGVRAGLYGEKHSENNQFGCFFHSRAPDLHFPF